MKIKNGKFNRESGMVVVEASFIFPIMFIILFILIYMGNAHYLKAQVEEIVTEQAIEGAKSCSDPLLIKIKETGSVPSLKDLKTEPYRYLFGGMDEIEKSVSAEVVRLIEEESGSFFGNMTPKVSTSTSKIAKFNNYVVYSTFSVEVEYVIEFPISFLGADKPIMLTVNSRADVPVNDTPEFIRNTDMVIDLFHGTKVGESISSVFGKIRDVMSNFAKK